MFLRFRLGVAVIGLTAAVGAYPAAQDRLKTMPGYEQFQKISREIPGSVRLGSLTAQWKEDGSSFEYTWEGKRYRYDVAAKAATGIGDAPAAMPGGGRGGQGAPARGRQFDSAESPDKKLKAFYEDRNMWLSAADGSDPNNVHPSNALQLIGALQQAGKSFEVQVGPDQGHSNVNQPRTMEFFIENLVMRQASPEGTR